MVDVEFKILHSCKIMTLTDQTKPDITGFCQATIKENVETYKFKAFLPNVYLKAMPLSIKIQQGKTILDNLFEKNGIKSKKYTLLKWSQKNYGSKISLQPSIEFIQSLRSQRNKLPKSMAKGGESNLLKQGSQTYFPANHIMVQFFYTEGLLCFSFCIHNDYFC